MIDYGLDMQDKNNPTNFMVNIVQKVGWKRPTLCIDTKMNVVDVRVVDVGRVVQSTKEDVQWGWNEWYEGWKDMLVGEESRK